MPIQVVVTDLQTHILYRGTLRTGIMQGQSVDIALDAKPGYGLRIGRIRGWLVSDSNLLYYLFDASGRRYKMRVILPTVIDSKP